MPNQPSPEKGEQKAQTAKWKALVAKFQKPSCGRASWQLINSLGSYIALWVVIYFTLQISWWIVIPLAILAGGFVVRTFIIQHDCGHGSFLKSPKANEFWGRICGFATFTPYGHWRWEHSTHHATSGDLDRRGVGDIWTMTVEEFLAASRWKRFSYRLSRNPIILFVIAPVCLFVIGGRFPGKEATAKARRSVWQNNLALLGYAVVMSWIFGIVPFLIIQLTIFTVASSAGVWLFYVQHQFEDVYWERGEDWDYTKAAIEGSSFYKLPKILQWFSGNIGFHHIHHLSPRIPNYNLERCHESDPMFNEVKPLTVLGSIKSASYRLWDEAGKRLITFREFNSMKHSQGGTAARDS